MGKKRIISQEFKEDAVRYRQNHPELSILTVATNLGINTPALGRWIEIAKKTNGTVYASEGAKEIARLKRELRNKERYPRSAKKSHRYSRRLTEAIYTATTDYVREQQQLPRKHRVSASGILRHLGASCACLNRLSSPMQCHKMKLMYH